MPTFQITAPDGKKYRITGENQEGALAALEDMLSKQTAPEPESTTLTEATNVFTGGMIEGVPLIGPTIRNGLDAVAAGIISGPMDFFSNPKENQVSYKEARDLIREQRGELTRENPGIDAAGQVTGAILSGLGAAGAGATAMRLVPKGLSAGKNLAATTAAMGADGVAFGTLDAIGRGEDVSKGAALGLIGGAGGNLAGRAISRVGSKVAGAFNKAPKTLSVDELDDAASAAYKQADDAGVIYSPQAVNRVRDNLKTEFADFGFHPELQPGAKVALSEIDRIADQPVTFKGLNTARKIAGSAFQPGNKSNNALAAKVTGQIDELFTNPQAGDVIGGNSAVASKALKRANNLHSRKMKLELVDKLLKSAGLRAGSTGTGGNVENASRQNLRRILDNPKFQRGFTKDEIAALEKAVLGNKKQNALRMIAGLSPTKGALMAALQTGSGFASGGATLPIAGAGIAADSLMNRGTRKSIDGLRNLIANGGNSQALLPAKNATQRAIESKKEALARALMAGTVATAP